MTPLATAMPPEAPRHRSRPWTAWRWCCVAIFICLPALPLVTPSPVSAQEAIPAPSPVLDPSQAGNIDLGAGERLDVDGPRRPGTVLDPNQAGDVDLRLEQALSGIEGKRESLPIIRLSGFFQLDDGLYSQPAASRERIGDALDGVSFRRTRLQAFGKLTEFTNCSITMDFAQAGRPSFMDVWGEQEQIPFFGTIRIGSPNAGIVNQATVGVNWYWNRFAKVQFNWIRSMPESVGYGAAPFDIYGTRFQVEC